MRSTKKKANLLWPAFDEKFQNYVEIAPESDIVRSPAPQAFYCAFWELYLPYIQNATGEMAEDYLVLEVILCSVSILIKMIYRKGTMTKPMCCGEWNSADGRNPWNRGTALFEIIPTMNDVAKSFVF